MSDEKENQIKKILKEADNLQQQSKEARAELKKLFFL